MKTACTEERFFKDVKDHALTIIRDDGNDRHLRFRKDGSMCYGFDLITWPGHLCISGDCGTYVFARIPDMFEFFRKSESHAFPERQTLFINTGYWGEKLLSVSRQEGYKEFSADVFVEVVTEHFSEWEFESDVQKKEVWEDVKDKVLLWRSDGEYAAMRAAMDYKSEFGHGFSDFWETSCKGYTFHYLWCLYAIVWGIMKYDEQKQGGHGKT